MPSVWTEVEVDVELSDFEDDDLLEEVERRKLRVSSDLIQQLHDAYILKQTDAVDRILRELFHDELGRLV
jgi:hypothetical protein